MAQTKKIRLVSLADFSIHSFSNGKESR